MKLLTLVLFVLSFCIICFCNQNSSDDVLCIPSERLALIDLKNNLTDPLNRLSSWVGNNCCTWSGVVCDNFTGHVHEIHLQGADDGIHGHCNTYFDTDDERQEALKQTLGGTISPSVTKLSQLRFLDLSCNNFGSNKIPAFMGSFKNLIYLNISNSNFIGEIPQQLGNVSTLSVLDLNDNFGDFLINLHSKSLKWLENLKGLEYLDMSGIDLSKASDWLPVTNNLTSLFEIHFSSCGLNNFAANSTTVSFSSLEVLDLSYNFYHSLLPGWIFRLSNLNSLDLTNCEIIGVTDGGFHNMPSLRTLRVLGNRFMSSSFMLNGLSSLSNLRLLDVRDCGISSPILGSLVHLPFIEYLDLSGNQIVEEIHKSFNNRCNFITLKLQFNKFYGHVSELLETLCECESAKLESLDLSDNQLIGRLPERLGKLKSLSFIFLTSNQLSGSIPDSLGSLSLLQRLDISGNNLSGSIPSTIGGLSSLGSLDVSNNKLNGSLPESIGRLSSLVYLDVSNNKLNGSLPESIGRLDKLVVIYLHSNLLTGIVTENHFGNLRALKTLWITGNKLVFKFDDNNWIPPFKLKDFRARSCSLGPQFPSWIQSQTDLTYLDVANTNISDTVPNSFWTAFSSLYTLNMSRNNIQGKLGDLNFHTSFLELDLSNNNLHGMLPGNFNTPGMTFLDLSNNNLSGSIEQFLCSRIRKQQYLTFLNLANNIMSGVISDCWTNWPSLIILNLEKNKFSGTIPSSLGNLSSLHSLDLNGNRLSGNLPPWLLYSRSLVIIDLAGNEFTGKIPSSTGNDYTSLRVLSLRSNNLEGEIPDEMCYLIYIQILDLARNHLSGSIPTCFTNFYLISGSVASFPFALNTTYNRGPDTSLVTKGFTYTYSTILYQVTSLDLSNNKFSGSIPNELVGFSSLRFLNLSHNNLKGTIPNFFNKSGMLESLDLSVNHLNGNIPLSLSQLTALSWLNLSYNNLVGRIPTGPQLQTFNESSFAGNALCGEPLHECSSNKDDPKGSNHGHDEPDGIDWILVILTLVGFVVGFWIMVIPLLSNKRWRKAYYHFLDGIWFKLQTFILVVLFCKS